MTTTAVFYQMWNLQTLTFRSRKLAAAADLLVLSNLGVTNPPIRPTHKATLKTRSELCLEPPGSQWLWTCHKRKFMQTQAVVRMATGAAPIHKSQAHTDLNFSDLTIRDLDPQYHRGKASLLPRKHPRIPPKPITDLTATTPTNPTKALRLESAHCLPCQKSLDQALRLASSWG
jgi:hypothetical protein